jgi:hypothetical protein
VTAVSRRLLGVLLAAVFVVAAAPGQDPTPPARPDAAPAQAPTPSATAEKSAAVEPPAPSGPEAMNDLVSFIFVICCLAAGVMAVAVAARVYARVRHDDPLIAAVNDPWVLAKIQKELAEGDVELTPADPRAPGR